AISTSPITSLSGETRPASSSGASATGGRRSNSRPSTLFAQKLSRANVVRRNLVERARAAAREAYTARREAIADTAIWVKERVASLGARCSSPASSTKREL